MLACHNALGAPSAFLGSRGDEREWLTWGRIASGPWISPTMEGHPCAGPSPPSLEGDPRPVGEFRFPMGMARLGPRGVDLLSHDGRMGRRGRRGEGRVAR
jgi:hypothetical protein